MINITIFCDGGLGNRLGTLIGGLLSAEKIGKSPIICWPANTWCGCLFSDIFELNYEVINYNINELFRNNQNKIFLIHENQTNFKLNKVFSHTLENLEILKSSDEEIIYYHNGIPNYFSKEDILIKLGSLKIQKYILDIFYNFIEKEKIDSDTIGIHFRKTDANGKLNEFAILDEIKANSDKKYFICSDDEQTENKFRSLSNVKIFQKTQYVEKLISGDWNDLVVDNEGRRFNYNVNRKKESVIQGFIDLLILSRTSMRGDEQSTFYNLAKLYSNINF